METVWMGAGLLAAIVLVVVVLCMLRVAARAQSMTPEERETLMREFIGALGESDWAAVDSIFLLAKHDVLLAERIKQYNEAAQGRVMQ